MKQKRRAPCSAIIKDFKTVPQNIQPTVGPCVPGSHPGEPSIDRQVGPPVLLTLVEKEEQH